MAHLRLKIEFDFERLRAMEGSLEWAVVSGLLSEDEAVQAAADDLAENMRIFEVKGGDET